jgi:hypothetical protein
MVLYFFLKKLLEKVVLVLLFFSFPFFEKETKNCINAQRNVCPRTAMFTKTLFSFLLFLVSETKEKKKKVRAIQYCT